MKITIARRLKIITTINLVLLAIVVIVAYAASLRVTRSTDTLINLLRKMRVVDQLHFSIIDSIRINDFLVSGDLDKKTAFELSALGTREVFEDTELIDFSATEKVYFTKAKDQFYLLTKATHQICNEAKSSNDFLRANINSLVEDIDIIAISVIEATENLHDSLNDRITVARLKNEHVKRLGLIIITSTSALAIILGIGGAIILGQRITKPVMKLASAARNITKGNFDERIDIKSNDEIGELAFAFNEMANTIEERTDKLERANANWKESFDSINDAITIHDEDYNIVRANKACEQLMNLPLDQIIGEKCYKVYHGQTCPPDGCLSCNILKTGKPCDFEVFEPSLNKYVEIKASPRFNSKGEMAGMVHVVRDITESKRNEKELQKVNKELVSASHRAGMAEVATDVLHNVGNVLNSVNVSTTMIGDILSNSKIPNLKKVADIIDDHVHEIGSFLTEDPQGKHIPSYLRKIAKLLTDEQAEIAEEVKNLAEKVEHIKEIVKMQQSYSKVTGVEVITSITEIIENAIKINSSDLERYGVTFETEFSELPDVSIEKQRTLQILVNLINNAKYAVSENQEKEKSVTIKCYRHDEDRLRIEVADNGIGIHQENMSKIFNHGFTTKQDGHGFGLHSGALAAKEMGGSLTVHSDGSGQGATFVLELPFKPAGVLI